MFGRVNSALDSRIYSGVRSVNVDHLVCRSSKELHYNRRGVLCIYMEFDVFNTSLGIRMVQMIE